MSVPTEPARPIASAHLAASGPSVITRVMASVAARRHAGHSVVGMHVGEPDFDTPDNIKRAAVAAIEQNDTHYTTVDGSLTLKTAIAAKYDALGVHFGTDQIVVGAGSKLLIFAAFFATLEPGDEVIVPAPYWGSYVDIIRMMLAVPVVVETSAADGFLMRPDALEAAISPRTRWVMFNSPSNPTGAVYERDDYAAVLEVIARHPHVWVLADDMYEHIVYDDVECVTPLQVRPDLASRTLVANGVSKAYAMTGWRIGYVAGPKPLTSLISAVLSQSTSCASSISQAAAVEALTGPQDSVARFATAYAERRRLILSELAAIPGLACVPPKGAFYAFVDWAAFHGATTRAGVVLTDDETFCRYLLDDHGLAVIPGAAFGASPYVRLSFACTPETIADGLARLRDACATLT